MHDKTGKKKEKDPNCGGNSEEEILCLDSLDSNHWNDAPLLINQLSRRLFNKSNKCWVGIGKKKIPLFYHILPFNFTDIFRKILKSKAYKDTFWFVHAVHFNIIGNNNRTIVASLFISKNIVERLRKNTDDPLGKYALLHGVNHASSALITQGRDTKYIFADCLIDYLTMLELAAMGNKKLEILNELLAFVHAIRVLRGNDEEFFKYLFDYCYNRNKGPKSGRESLMKAMNIDETMALQMEYAEYFNKLIQMAHNKFGDKFDDVFEGLLP